jgi:PIN domain nuclease of toxin-antitoxin system
MRVLLDTHVLLWILSEPSRLDEETRETIAADAEEVLFSAASIWEIAIKSRLGRADADPPHPPGVKDGSASARCGSSRQPTPAGKTAWRGEGGAGEAGREG